MPCPYLDRGFCEVKCEPCEGKRAFANCESYGAERKRLRAVVAACPWATRRVHRLDDRKVWLDHWVWCHAPDRDAHICHGWPDDCPEHWRLRYEQLRAALGGKARIERCARCGSPFLQQRSDARVCSRSCGKLLAEWRRRRRAGIPERPGRLKHQGAMRNGRNHDH
jgi:hypothetical protein